MNYYIQIFSATANAGRIINNDTRHLFFPTIVTYALVTLFILMILVNSKKIIATIKNTIKNIQKIDLMVNKLVFFGNLTLLFGYVVLLELIGFAVSTLIYIFLSILLFYKKSDKTTMMRAGIVSVTTTVLVVVVFGILFRITLP